MQLQVTAMPVTEAVCGGREVDPKAVRVGFVMKDWHSEKFLSSTSLFPPALQDGRILLRFPVDSLENFQITYSFQYAWGLLSL
jgi:hypothetical protein